MKQAAIIISQEGEDLSLKVDFNGTYDEDCEAHTMALAIAQAVAEQSGSELEVIKNVQ
jgi:hypothetical protein